MTAVKVFPFAFHITDEFSHHSSHKRICICSSSFGSSVSWLSELEVFVNMEGLYFVILYLALTPSQAEAVLNGLGAMPQESSKRFGLRTNKMAAVQRSQYFHEWEARYGSGENPGLTHKDFVVVTMRITSFGFVSKMCGEILQKMNKEEYRWHGGLQMKETLPDGRIIYELIEFEKIM